jgi:hypothetical protein
MSSGARILLGAVLGGVLRCVIGVLSFLLVSVSTDGPAHLGETLAGIGLLVGLAIAATLVAMRRGNVVMGAIAVLFAAGGGAS